jgi:hypothetical protein
MSADIVDFPKGNGPAAPLTRPPVTILSFVRDAAPTSRSDKRRCFWAVTPTGDYGEDCRIGHRLAIEYLRFEREDQGGPGGTPGVQYFVGASCGGDGWGMWDVWPPTGRAGPRRYSSSPSRRIPGPIEAGMLALSACGEPALSVERPETVARYAIEVFEAMTRARGCRISFARHRRHSGPAS